ncbi:type IV secretory system conjugative DNA transfer family protein [Bacillus sp. DX1.1]|nr:type IV secretory system conjugative DNA transfer family protein [Bacillus sp. DX1.1]MDM5152530.1 type IV secretory system conjugative DNA transfer family protein [Bacillus sp. DX1.1]
MHDEKKPMKYVLAEKKVLIPMSAFLFIGIFLVSNFLLNLVLELIRTTFNNVLKPEPFHIESGYLFQMPVSEYPIYYMIVFLVACGIVVKTVYSFRSSFKDLNKDQKGSGRFSPLEELKQQYRAIPDKTERYAGKGGIVISRYDTFSWETFRNQMHTAWKAQWYDKWKEWRILTKSLKVGRLLIDDGAVNNLIIGTTRSGKGKPLYFQQLMPTLVQK